ncbi:MAG TPA: type II secretion system protein F, partial [Gammaproteobacteria bacterium]|nr:type II secretion system protein F [Gammaproteobacteria bacterium]
KVLGKLSFYYQKDMQRKLQSTAKAMEPIMLMFMGVLVGLIVSSLILPIFKLSSAVG